MNLWWCIIYSRHSWHWMLSIFLCFPILLIVADATLRRDRQSWMWWRIIAICVIIWTSVCYNIIKYRYDWYACMSLQQLTRKIMTTRRLTHTSLMLCSVFIDAQFTPTAATIRVCVWYTTITELTRVWAEWCHRAIAT